MGKEHLGHGEILLSHKKDEILPFAKNEKPGEYYVK
jgi:hypothetical protein